MVKFGEYFESMVALKPEWRNAYMNYSALNKLLSTVKKGVVIAAPRSPSAQSESQPLLGPTTPHPQSPSAAPHVNDDHYAAVPHGPESMQDDEDTFMIARSEPIPIGGGGDGGSRRAPTDSSMQLLGTPSIAAFGMTPPIAGTGGRGHSIYGASFRGLPYESATPETMHRLRTSSIVIPAASDQASNPESPALAPQTATMPPPTANTSGAPYVSFAPMSGPVLVVQAPDRESPPMPHMTPSAVSAAKMFEELLLQEVTKSVDFATKSYSAFVEFVEENRASWKNPKTSTSRTKDSMRYLNKEIGHLIQFIETNELAIKTATKKYLHSHPFYIREEVSEESLLPKFEAVLEQATVLQGHMESLWAEQFSDGDINAARSRIVGVSASSTQSFRAGVFFALIIACGLYWLHVRFELRPTQDVMNESDWMYPITRLCITLTFAGICWGWVLYIFERQKINYLYVFEFSQTASTTWMQCLEYNLLMFFLCSLFSVMYVRASLHTSGPECYSTAAGFPFLAPYMLPSFLVIWISTIVFPIRHVFRKTRNAFARVFFQCMHLPFGDVRFVEFFVADWGTSMVIPCGDLLYLLCFYTAEAPNAFTNSPSNVCNEVQAKYNFPVSMIPYFWRACQTFKMYQKTRVKAHLVNHGKYQTFMIYFLVSWANALWPSTALNNAVWFWHFAAQVYAWIWDILMDWGWIKGRERAMMFKSKRPYIAAAITDFVLRMYFFTFTLWVQPKIDANNAMLIQGMVEVFRRSMWSIFRIENENINNLESYRKIDFVPHVAPRDEFS